MLLEVCKEMTQEGVGIVTYVDLRHLSGLRPLSGE